MSISITELRADAQSWLNHNHRVLELAQLAAQKAKQNHTRLQKIFDDLRLMLRLIKYWSRREYTDIPWNSLLAIIGALIYFVNPMDLIPDFVHGLGLLDDASIIALVMAATRSDLDRFRAWHELSAKNVGTDAITGTQP